MIRISTGSAVRWAMGWAPANFLSCLCQFKYVHDKTMYMNVHTPFLHHKTYILVYIYIYKFEL